MGLHTLKGYRRSNPEIARLKQEAEAKQTQIERVERFTKRNPIVPTKPNEKFTLEEQLEAAKLQQWFEEDQRIYAALSVAMVLVAILTIAAFVGALLMGLRVI